MSDQLKSQAMGLSLAVTTAIGCVAYERLVKAFSYRFVVVFVAASYAWLFVVACCLQEPWREDWGKLWLHRWSLLLYFLSGVTSILWYFIVKKQSVMVGSVYEVKYIVILGIFYACFGTGKITVNTVAGAACALLSIWFISKG